MNHAIPLTDNNPPIDKTIEIVDIAHRKSIVSEHDIVVIKYSAEWCGPCKAIAREYKQDLPFEFPDVTWCEEDIDEEFGEYAKDITTVPTFHIFRNHEFVTSTKGQDLNAVRSVIRGFEGEIPTELHVPDVNE
jgi:thiol-disulfide isomerase/thioredoxin